MPDDVLAYYYARYGLADALYMRLGARRPEAAEAALRELSREELVHACEERVRDLLREVRVHFPRPEYPPNSEEDGDLVRDPDGTAGEQIAEHGYYVRPHVMVTDGRLNGPNGLIENPIPDKKLLQRYYPPATRLSVGKSSASNVRKTPLFGLACTIASLTPLKAARRTGGSDRAGVIPDLPIGDLITYLDLYMEMLPSLPAPTRARTGDDGKPYLLQNWGTFPDPPPGWSFGTLGVVAGIGSWARKNDLFEDAEPILKRLATTRVYVIDTSGDDNRVESGGSHVAQLARKGALRAALDDAWRIRTEAREEELQRTLRRWLLLFTPSSFQNFLAVRATYPSSFTPILNTYFMETHEPSLIESARATGQHVNSQAWHAADGKKKETRRKNKQTILASLESMLYDCDDGAEMIARLTTQVGRLTGSDFPHASTPFFDATVDDNGLSVKKARNLLLAYMRLRGTERAEATGTTGESGTEATTDAPPSDAATDPSTGSYDPDSEIANL